MFFILFPAVLLRGATVATALDDQSRLYVSVVKS